MSVSTNPGEGYGTITANGVISYVYKRVSADRNSKQTRHFGFFEGDGDFVSKARDFKTGVHGDYALMIYRRTASTKFAARIEDSLVSQLQEINTDARLLAVQQIGGALARGYDDTPQIVAKLLGHSIADDDDEMRAGAHFVFAEYALTGDIECVEELRKNLHDQNAEIRWLAASSLANIGTNAAAAISDLIEALVDNHYWVGEDASRALNTIGGSAWNALRDMSDKKYVRLYNEFLDGEGTTIEE